ncbi:MAG: hypothetical protein ACK4OJ_00575 [Brevundimonas sp.]
MGSAAARTSELSALLSPVPQSTYAYVFKAAHGGRISGMTISAVLRRLAIASRTDAQVDLYVE